MLPSQNARSTSARSMTSYRGWSRQWLAVTGVVTLVVAVILGVRWLGGSGAPDPADAGTPSTNATGLVAGNVGGGKPSPAANEQRKPAGAVAPTGQQQRISMAGGGAPAGESAPQPSSGRPQEPARPGSDATAGQGKSQGDPAKPPPSPTQSGMPPASNTPIATSQPAEPTVTRLPASPSSAGAQERINLGLQLVKENRPVEARRVLTEALRSSGLAPADAERVRNELSAINQRLVFSPEIVSTDPFVVGYQVQGGDALAKIPRKVGASVDWRFVQRINKINDPARLHVGQRVKVVKGPFHAVVDKPAFRLDLYMGDGSDRVFVASFPVGLGEYGATPEGEFIVKPNSKLEDPAWTNPRTGEHFASKDPFNPLGHYWVGLVGVSDNIRGLEGYGLHGTIEPDSIGQERSMGCVRMRDDDIRVIFELLIENVSHVEIHGPDWP